LSAEISKPIQGLLPEHNFQVMLLAWVDSKVASWIPKVDFRVFVKNPPRGADHVSQLIVIESFYCERFSKWIPPGFPGESACR
jgi:hypothetical protein